MKTTEGNMSLDTSCVPELSAQQRRCNILLMLCAPLQAVQLEQISQINGVDFATTLQDIDQLSAEIIHLYQLEIVIQQDRRCHLRGNLLNQRICLITILRRTVRSNPNFLHRHFTASLQQALSKVADFNSQRYFNLIPRLIENLSQMLDREFSVRDQQFLQIYLQYCLWQSRECEALQLSELQHRWLKDKPEYSAALIMVNELQALCNWKLDECETDFFALLLRLIKNHNYNSSGSAEDQKLMHETEALVARFQHQSGMTFSSYDGLISQLFAHLGPAIERCRFDIGIDSQLQDEVNRMYPRLMRTTRAALERFRQVYNISLSEEEVGLVAVSFGAWLMHGNALQEKQILLLTGQDPALEETVEQQLREATLLPLNIKYQTLEEFHQQGAPRGVAMIVTPYAVLTNDAAPLVIHTQIPLSKEERKKIRLLLEAH